MKKLDHVGLVGGAWAAQEGGAHYKSLAIQPMQYSMANDLNSLQHTVIKYVTRYKDKNELVDLKKARHSIDMLIEWEEQKMAEIGTPPFSKRGYEDSTNEQ